MKKESRRSVLKKGLLGGAILALGGMGALAVRKSKSVPLPPEGLLFLGPSEYAVVSALAFQMIPGVSGAPSVEEARVAFHADRTLAQAKVDAQKDFKRLLGLFENGLSQFLFEFKTQPFTQLSLEEQYNVLQSWQHSRLALRRTGFIALRTLLTACYYGNPATWAFVGYPGPPRGIFDADAPVWKGEGPRPSSHGGVTP